MSRSFWFWNVTYTRAGYTVCLTNGSDVKSMTFCFTCVRRRWAAVAAVVSGEYWRWVVVSGGGGGGNGGNGGGNGGGGNGVGSSCGGNSGMVVA